MTNNCHWQSQHPSLQHYHDHEWGVVTKDDHLLFEKLCLESLQAGLSWRIVLQKREAYRHHFANFDFHKIATFKTSAIDLLCDHPKLIRHRKKCYAIVNNAKIACQITQKHPSFAAFIWQFAPKKQHAPHHLPPEEVHWLVQTLQQHGWQWLGITTAYAFMEAAGLINNHDQDCPRRAPLQAQTRCR